MSTRLSFSKKNQLVNAKTQNKIIKNNRVFYKKNQIFFKYDRVVCKNFRWVSNSKNFRNILNLRNRVYQYFDGVFSNKYFKKQFQNKSDYLDLLRYSFIKPEFRLDIILWRLHFFSSPYSARVAIIKQQVLVNNCVVNFSYFLNQGDVVSLTNLINLKTLKNLKFFKFSLQPFIEIDYYTNSFIILQDYRYFNIESFPCLIRQPFKATSLLNYLKIK